MDAVDWLKSESEVGKPAAAPWLKSRSELETAKVADGYVWNVLKGFVLLGPRSTWNNRLDLRMVPKTWGYAVLFFSRPWSECWPWSYFLHLSLSSVIMINSFRESPVHVLMLSIQALRSLPRLCTPGIVPCIISCSRQLPCFLLLWP